MSPFLFAQKVVNRAPKIKVLLGEFDLTKEHKFTITSKKDFLLRTNKKTFILHSKHFQITTQNKTLYGRGSKGPFKKIKSDHLEIKPSSKTILVNNKPYHGTLSLVLTDKKLLLINKLDLEDYVYAVLLAESYQTWPHEMQKIQAIVSRTYAVHQMLERRKKRTRPFDIKSNTFHQRYTGKHSFHHLRQAVDETKNLILTHNNNVVLTMFDACCGGSVPANMQGIEFSKAPYLARKTACTYCKTYKLYSWKRTIPLTTFYKSLCAYKPLISRLKNTKKLSNVTITNKDKAGVVHGVQLKLTTSNGSPRTVTITGNDVWLSMSSKIRSQNFSLEQKNNKICISGNGFGHQIGLCQRGARELVRKGWPLKKVLSFYYPKTLLARLHATPPQVTPSLVTPKPEQPDAIV